jgi:hypothetical protein
MSKLFSLTGKVLIKALMYNTAPPIKNADAPGTDNKQAETRPPLLDSATASVGRHKSLGVGL